MTLTLKLAAIAVSALTLSACTNPDGSMNQPANGALIGGLTGAALGNAIGHDRTSTLIGGAVGIAVGDAIGRQAASQKAELDRALAGTGATVTSNGQQIEIILPENVTFATNSDAVDPGFLGPLGRIAQSLRAHPRSTILVLGHTDSVGVAAYNQDLSMRRALAVANILVGDGVPATRLTYAGRGESQPIASNATTSGRAMNRRVEIFITPTQ
jgi:outer membrane protein OmpA-like peptidoglycan-associated protein